MPLRKCTLFLMEESSSFDDLDLEELLLDDDVKQMLLLLTAKEIED
jgi:hypothetical protein